MAHFPKVPRLLHCVPEKRFWFVAVCALVLTVGVTGQTENTAKERRFAVVSIRQNKTGGPQIFGKATADGWQMRNMFLAAAILTAYVPSTGTSAMYKDDQLVGLLPWLVSDDDKFDIEARIDEKDLEDWQSPAKQPAMLRAMLQSMLADRMKLKVHRSSREAPIYALVVGRKGPRFAESNPDESHPGAYPMPGGGQLSIDSKDGWVTTHYFGVSMNQVVTVLLPAAGRPVEDRTGLRGKYDLTILKPLPTGAGTPQVGQSDETSAAEIAEQLGLKLEPTNGQVETLVIDHVEHPSVN